MTTFRFCGAKLLIGSNADGLRLSEVETVTFQTAVNDFAGNVDETPKLCAHQAPTVFTAVARFSPNGENTFVAYDRVGFYEDEFQILAEWGKTARVALVDVVIGSYTYLIPISMPDCWTCPT